MALSFFVEKHLIPTENETTGILGQAAGLWNEIKKYLEKQGPVKEEWKIYTQKAGWCKKLLLLKEKEERNIIFLYPNTDCITGVMVYGEKAVEAARVSSLPYEIIERILSAKPYKEGRSFQIEIRNAEDYLVLKKLMDIKLQN